MQTRPPRQHQQRTHPGLRMAGSSSRLSRDVASTNTRAGVVAPAVPAPASRPSISTNNTLSMRSNTALEVAARTGANESNCQGDNDGQRQKYTASQVAARYTHFALTTAHLVEQQNARAGVSGSLKQLRNRPFRVSDQLHTFTAKHDTRGHQVPATPPPPHTCAIINHVTG